MPVPAHIGVQLWSVRDDMKKDAKGTIEALAKFGYREVEAFGFDAGSLFGMPYKEFKTLLRNNGIAMPSTHSMFTLKNWDDAKGDLTDATKKIIDDAAATGLKYIVAPYMIDEDRKQIDKVVKMFNAAGAYAKKAGVRFGYHNHDFEFTNRGADNRLIMEWILHETDPKLVTLELDLYWVAKAGYNAKDWFKQYPGRWELCHAKDMAKTDKKETVEVGDGSIDFKEIFRQSAQAGLQYYIVELENYVSTPMQGVEKARKNLVKMFS
jgi:sugar phosphate isomerase/epimerase